MLQSILVLLVVLKVWLGLVVYVRWACASPVGIVHKFRIFYHSISVFFCSVAVRVARLIFMLEKFPCKYLCFVTQYSDGVYLAHGHLLSRSVLFWSPLSLFLRNNNSMKYRKWDGFVRLLCFLIYISSGIELQQPFYAPWFMIIIFSHSFFPSSSCSIFLKYDCMKYGIANRFWFSIALKQT